MSDASDDTPKIFVDDDWKQQAKQEKERLADEEQQAESAQGGPGQMPEASFSVHVSTMVSQIMFALGLIRQENQDKVYVNLEVAKFYIEILRVLEEKTSGNLTDEEAKLLKGAISESQMAFVQVANAIAQNANGGPQPGGPRPQA